MIQLLLNLVHPHGKNLKEKKLKNRNKNKTLDAIIIVQFLCIHSGIFQQKWKCTYIFVLSYVRYKRYLYIFDFIYIYILYKFTYIYRYCKYKLHI